MRSVQGSASASRTVSRVVRTKPESAVKRRWDKPELMMLKGHSTATGTNFGSDGGPGGGFTAS